jgi:hypothetical protein
MILLEFSLKYVLYQPIRQGQGQADTPLSAGVARMEQTGSLSEDAAVHTHTASMARRASRMHAILNQVFSCQLRVTALHCIALHCIRRDCWAGLECRKLLPLPNG